MNRKWVVGTRGSKLALLQTGIVIEHLTRIYPDDQFEIKTIKTTGDTVWDKPLHLIGGKGLFVKEIEEELLTEKIDLAVHSMKDVPTELERGLAIGAVLKREDPRDVFISQRYQRIAEIRDGAKIGTNSVRRKSQILNYKRDAEVVPLRGNVDTRIRKMEEQGLDGIILAYAGVKRMGFDRYIREILPLDIMVPPSGQGAIGVEIRDDQSIHDFLKPINDDRSFAEVFLERRLQTAIGGGCHVPLGIHAEILDRKLTLQVVLGNEDGVMVFKEKRVSDLNQADQLVSEISETLRQHRNGIT